MFDLIRLEGVTYASPVSTVKEWNLPEVLLEIRLDVPGEGPTLEEWTAHIDP